MSCERAVWRMTSINWEEATLLLLEKAARLWVVARKPELRWRGLRTKTSLSTCSTTFCQLWTLVWPETYLTTASWVCWGTKPESSARTTGPFCKRQTGLWFWITAQSKIKVLSFLLLLTNKPNDVCAIGPPQDVLKLYSDILDDQDDSSSSATEQKISKINTE